MPTRTGQTPSQRASELTNGVSCSYLRDQELEFRASVTEFVTDPESFIPVCSTSVFSTLHP
jgi:hypothetical protein